MSRGRPNPQSRCFLLYRGKERLRLDNIQCLPVGEFLAALHPRRAIGEGL